jgi:hypothetical protein
VAHLTPAIPSNKTTPQRLAPKIVNAEAKPRLQPPQRTVRYRHYLYETQNSAAQPRVRRTSPHLRFTKWELGSFAGVLQPKVRDRYAHESDAYSRREDRPDQDKGDLMQLVPGAPGREKA